jgi:hypothetical protein
MTPSTNQVICVNESIAFGSTPQGGCPPYTFLWSFQNVTPPANTSTMQNPGMVTFGANTLGKVNNVTVTVTDSIQATASANITVTVPKVNAFKHKR